MLAKSSAKLAVTVVENGAPVATIERTTVRMSHPYENRKVARKVPHVMYSGQYFMVMYWSPAYSHLATLEVGTPFIKV
jgi:hypothetical protein